MIAPCLLLPPPRYNIVSYRILPCAVLLCAGFFFWSVWIGSGWFWIGPGICCTDRVESVLNPIGVDRIGLNPIGVDGIGLNPIGSDRNWYDPIGSSLCESDWFGSDLFLSDRSGSFLSGQIRIRLVFGRKIWVRPDSVRF